MWLLHRLATVWRSRGPLGFIRFAGSRLLQHRRDIVFDAELAAEEPRWNGDGVMLFVDRANRERALTDSAVAQLSQGEGADYVAGLRDQDLLFAVIDGSGRILHHSYVLFDTRTKSILGESPQTPLFAHCVTAPEARGRRLYPQTLHYGLRVLAARGHRRAVINCDPGNGASIAGIERAGFRPSRRLDTWILGSCVGIQRVRTADGRQKVRLYFG